MDKLIGEGEGGGGELWKVNESNRAIKQQNFWLNCFSPLLLQYTLWKKAFQNLLLRMILMCVIVGMSEYNRKFDGCKKKVFVENQPK